MRGSPLKISASAVLCCTVLTSCWGRADDADEGPAQPPLVEAVPAGFGALPIEEVVPGVVRARNQVAIRPEIAGRVVEVLVRSGEPVERGQPLVRLEQTEARERLRQAEADVRLEEAAAVAARARVTELEARLARTETLAEQELVSTQELESLQAQGDALRAAAEEARARVEQAQATVEERRSVLDKTIVRAPVAGRLGERRVEVGMLVDPSTFLFLVGDLDELIVEIDLTETMLRRVEEGLPVRIEARGDIAPVDATLSRISPFLAQGSFSTVGEIDLDNPGRSLRPGMFVTVRILVGRSQLATLVPVSAVWEDPSSGERGVFVVQEADGLEEPTGRSTASPEESRAIVFRRVETLAEGRGTAAVTGIDEGTWVVTVGQHLLAADLRLTAAAAASESSGSSGLQGSTLARVRPVAWKWVQELQGLQDEDLLEGFLDKQRKIAAAIGAEIPASEDVVDRLLEEAGPGDTSQSGID